VRKDKRWRRKQLNEEKDLQEEDITADEGMEDLSSFVDFADLDELEYTDNQDIFGDLGDIGDLGEIPDLSLDNLAQGDDSGMEEGISVPDLTAEEPEESPFHTVEPAEDLSVPDLIEEEKGSVPELLPEEDALMSEPDEISNMGSDIPGPDELSDAENDLLPGLDELSDAQEDMPAAELDVMADMESDTAVPEQDMEETMTVPDMDMDSGMTDSIGDEIADIPMPDDFSTSDAGPILDDAVSDILAGEDGMGDLDLGFSDGGESAPAAEENSGSGLDSMLGGLLGDLDMGGSFSEDSPLGLDDAAVSMDDLSELSADTEDMLDISGMVPEKQQTEKAPGLLKRVFGNVVTDEIAEQERMAAQKEEEEAAKKEEEEAKAKEEAAAKKEEKKAEKAAKKEEKKKLKEAKKAGKAAAKEEKKKQKEEEAAAEAAELEVVGKLNKVGVSIIVIATILFLVVEIAGTNMFGYISTKNKAVDYFEMGRYTQAYQEAIGTNMSEKDKEEYEKIKVVMKVQQSLNAYQNYDRVNYYPEALDALLRGLKRYDANIDRGMELEVDSDMMSCRKEILTLLQEDFNLSESDAYSILALDSEKYQKKVVELGLKKR